MDLDLLAHVLGRDRAWLVAHSETPLTPEQSARYEALSKRRQAGEPLEYITGSAWFCGREFIVNPNVLVPRPETEHLVEDAVGFVKGLDVARPSFDTTATSLPSAQDDRVVLDVGIGSGAIACTIAAELADVRVDGVDISREAVDVASENAKRLGLAERCNFVVGDLLEPVAGKLYDVIVANLPYVPTADIAPAPNPIAFEPRRALDGGPDGLEVYRKFLPQAGAALKPGGLLLLEAAPPLMEGLVELARASLPNSDIEVRDDYGRRQRYVRLIV